MKKKVISIALVIALVAVIAAGSFAYFTDKDAATNTFTVGNVKINLIEQQRDGKGGLESFKNGKNLMPIVGSAQGEKDALGMPTAKNYVDKVVTIENNGTNDAYVRAYFAIPSALDDGCETFNAGMNVLHFNFGNKVENGVVTSTFGHEWLWKNASGTWKYFETTINDVAYNVYYADYYKTLAAGDTTEQFIQGVYLDMNIDTDAQGNYVDSRYPEADLSILNVEVNCPVYAVAVQADGFDSADEAVTAAFGANYNPWGGDTINWQK